MTKWGDRPHWEFECLMLGSDDDGDWLGLPAGTSVARPGLALRIPVDQVCLAPAPGPDAARGWVATFHAPRGQVHTYVDMTTPPRWDGRTLRAVDLDLDVVRETDGRVWVDDEDEFALHRVELGYPDEIAELSVSSCEHVRTAVETRAAPFDGRADAWLERLARG